ncbi:5732_t:CDS:2 [Gigaspora margarita]|uniref:5732_t:CDS:1 n=1 Tax=Gigaspora margarita TaxID=4874 RepID=A0ABN7ULG3_GIGMA|nr:5732_t:CDS:2 [Gigaspora margarita]
MFLSERYSLVHIKSLESILSSSRTSNKELSKNQKLEKISIEKEQASILQCSKYFQILAKSKFRIKDKPISLSYKSINSNIDRTELLLNKTFLRIVE